MRGLVRETGPDRRALLTRTRVLFVGRKRRCLRAHDPTVAKRIAYDEVVVFDADGHARQRTLEGARLAYDERLVGDLRVVEHRFGVSPRELGLVHPSLQQRQQPRTPVGRRPKRVVGERVARPRGDGSLFDIYGHG